MSLDERMAALAAYLKEVGAGGRDSPVWDEFTAKVIQHVSAAISQMLAEERERVYEEILKVYEPINGSGWLAVDMRRGIAREIVALLRSRL